MKKLSIVIIALLLTLPMLAQESAVITFEKRSHDFGKINEEGGLASYTFTYKNTGDQALVLNRVQASCGCTATSWSREPVLPGQSSSITVNYNPMHRPGTFMKSIAVYSNGSKQPIMLSIKGNVTPKPAVIQ